jgi:large subunit ribosomal protein L30
MAAETNARTAGVREGATLRITLVKSLIGQKHDQVETAKSLGLRRLNSTVERPDSAVVRGMIFKIKHLLAVEEVS